jgi:competence protein ComEC
VVGAVWILMPRGWPLRWAGWILWLPLAWPGAIRLPVGEFRVTALDVGQGSAILVQTRSRVLVFDTGPRYGEQHDAGRVVVVPALASLGVRSLDRLVLGHADTDHAGGAASVFDAYPVDRLRASLEPRDRLWARSRDASPCRRGERWERDGVRFEMLWPADPGEARRNRYRNAPSCVLRISTARVSALLTGDIEAAQEARLVATGPQDLAADLLIVPHHGSRTSSTEGFLDSIAPRVAIFQVGYRNRFGHPHPGVVSRYEARGVQMYRSDRDGAVRVTSSAGALRVEPCRSVRRRYWVE